MIEFFIPLKSPPTTTFQDKEINWKTKSFYKSYDVKQIEHLYRMHLAQHVPKEKITGPVRLITKWCYPYPDYFTAKDRVPTFKTSKPDTENMVKLLKDQMTYLGFWNDDAQVASDVIEKFWAEPTGIYCKIESL